VEDYVEPSEPGEVLKIGRALEERGHYEGRQLHRRKDGSVFPCSLNLKTLIGGDRKLVIGVHRDMTEELKAQEFFRVLFEKSSDAIYLVADEGLQVVQANEAACRLAGYPREEFLRLTVADLVPPAYRNRIPEYHAAVKATGYRRDRRVLQRRDGSVVATDQAVSRVEISGRPYYIASCRDLTEQERAGKELEEAKAFLEHVQEIRRATAWRSADENATTSRFNYISDLNDRCRAKEMRRDHLMQRLRPKWERQGRIVRTGNVS
jgi:PAS domain S-box-containing protein